MSRLRTALKALTVVGGLSVATIGGYEGLRLYSYQDVIGVWTYCYGETKNAKPGMRFTKAQCDAIFIERLEQFEAGMRKCLVRPDSIPDKPYVAFLSLAYNVGVGAFCKSTLARKANAGDLRGACDELPKWNRAGGRVIRGLTIRRAQERKLCLEGL